MLMSFVKNNHNRMKPTRAFLTLALLGATTTGTLVLPPPAAAQEFGSAEYCDQLADIGAKAYRTKVDGHSLSAVLRAIGPKLAHDPQKKDAAEGVVIAIYGDSSIRSAADAYTTVFSACKR